MEIQDFKDLQQAIKKFVEPIEKESNTDASEEGVCGRADHRAQQYKHKSALGTKISEKIAELKGSMTEPERQFFDYIVDANGALKSAQDMFKKGKELGLDSNIVFFIADFRASTNTFERHVEISSRSAVENGDILTLCKEAQSRKVVAPV
jgi:hypothetical protein